MKATLTHCEYCYVLNLYTVCDDCIVEHVKDVEYNWNDSYYIERDEDA